MWWVCVCVLITLFKANLARLDTRIAAAGTESGNILTQIIMLSSTFPLSQLILLIVVVETLYL